MDDEAPTVRDLVARFQLRRRAPTTAFRDGVRLARAVCVRISSQTSDHVRAIVLDPTPLEVELRVEEGSLIGRCSCPVAAVEVCRHQVAVAHVVWVSARAGSNRDAGQE